MCGCKAPQIYGRPYRATQELIQPLDRTLCLYALRQKELGGKNWELWPQQQLVSLKMQADVSKSWSISSKDDRSSYEL